MVVACVHTAMNHGTRKRASEFPAQALPPRHWVLFARVKNPLYSKSADVINIVPHHYTGRRRAQRSERSSAMTTREMVSRYTERRKDAS